MMFFGSKMKLASSLYTLHFMALSLYSGADKA